MVAGRGKGEGSPFLDLRNELGGIGFADQIRFLAANQKRLTADLGKVRRHTTRESKPGGVELVAESAIGFFFDGVSCDVLAQRFGGMARLREELVARDRILKRWVRAPKGEREPRSSARCFGSAAGEVNEEEATSRGEAACVVECDCCPHGMADEDHVLSAKGLQKGFEINAEGADFVVIREFRVAMAAKVESVDRCFVLEFSGEGASDMIPPMRVRAAAMKQDDGYFGLVFGQNSLAKAKKMQSNAIHRLELKRLWIEVHGHCPSRQTEEARFGFDPSLDASNEGFGNGAEALSRGRFRCSRLGQEYEISL